VTARAVLLLQELDQEIRKKTDNQRSLDDVTRGLMRLEKASTKDFIEICESILGGKSAVLDTRLLR
jgi:predicted metalloprotease with PDZ domain